MGNNPYIAQLLLEHKAVQINSKELFTFSSGIKSPIYCDNRLLIGIPVARKVIVNEFLKNIDDSIDVIVGTSTAGIPWASFIAQILDKPMAYVRSVKKSHGTKKLIEGSDLHNKNVVIIEDLITTGSSVIETAHTVLLEKPKSVMIQAIFTYGFKHTQSVFQKESMQYNTITTLEELLAIGKEKEYLTQNDIEAVIHWKKEKEN